MLAARRIPSLAIRDGACTCSFTGPRSTAGTGPRQAALRILPTIPELEKKLEEQREKGCKGLAIGPTDRPCRRARRRGGDAGRDPAAPRRPPIDRLGSMVLSVSVGCGETA